MNSGLPKQFLLLGGTPVLIHAMKAFYRFDPRFSFFIVLPETFIPLWKELCARHSLTIGHEVVPGGENRFHSVRNALARVPASGLVAIHDGVRPLVSEATIAASFRMASLNGNAVPVIPVNESIRLVSESGNEPVQREHLRIVQTPQVFRAARIMEAYEKAPHDRFTDDATVLELLGEKICLVEGNRENIKITYPGDLAIAEALLGANV
jgi:2-C-methyl-D-erythritol 4-phosphate cytidylyltransferase